MEEPEYMIVNPMHAKILNSKHAKINCPPNKKITVFDRDVDIIYVYDDKFKIYQICQCNTCKNSFNTIIKNIE